jgi:hypothetical protein
MRLLTLSRSLKVDVHGSFYSIGTCPMIAIFFSAASPTYQYSVEHTLIQPIDSLFRGSALNESTNC